jgi:hypothetical protein
MRLLIGCLLCLLAACAAPVPGGGNNGQFVGHVVPQWLDDGRKMKLVEPFRYIDPTGLSWDAPIGAVVDGASIPQVAWSVIGGPFEGKYRNASVIHDVVANRIPSPSDPLSAFVIAEYRPTPATMTASDFDKLRGFIEATNPSLAAIENYRP